MNISNKKRLVTYSLLASLEEENVQYGFDFIFVPIVKKALIQLNNKGYVKGKSIIEIRDEITNDFGLDFPLPYLKKIINIINQQFLVEFHGKILLHNDNSFQFEQNLSERLNTKMLFDIENKIVENTKNIEIIENLFKKFLEINNFKEKKDFSLIDFIDINKISLTNYFATEKPGMSNNERNFDAEILLPFAKFFLEIKKYEEQFKILKRIYLGSIYSSYLTLEPEQSNFKLELVLDTSFIIGLLRLMSEETSDTCIKIYELSKKLGFKITVLKITIEETQNMLNNLVTKFNTDIIVRKTNPESILAACDRRGIVKTELARISSRLEDQLQTKYKINIVKDDSKYRNLAMTKYISIYNFLKEKRYRNKESTAFHDTVCEAYVKELRGRPIHDFLNSRAWFVIGSSLNIHRIRKNYDLPAFINSAALINILWLSNPSARNNLNINDLTDIGITKMISSILDNFLPPPQVMEKFEKNIISLSNKNVDLTDCIFIATKIAQREVFEDLNAVIDKNHNDNEKIIKEINKRTTELKQKNEQSDKLFKEEIAKSTQEFFINFINEINEEKTKKEKAQLDKEKLKKELDKLKHTLVTEKSTKDFKKWQIIGYLSIPIVLLLLIFIILLFSFPNEEWNIASRLMNWTDELSESRRNTFYFIISGLIGITQFLSISIIWNRLISKENKQKKRTELIEYYNRVI